MRVPHTARSRSMQLTMTPMVDVVFLLIIFFLVSSHLAQQETQLELDLPTAASGEEALQTASPRVTINVRQDGQVILGGDTISPADVADRLEYERRRTEGDLQVRIRSDRAAPYGIIKPLLVACAEAGVWNVSFAVLEE